MRKKVLKDAATTAEIFDSLAITTDMSEKIAKVRSLSQPRVKSVKLYDLGDRDHLLHPIQMGRIFSLKNFNNVLKDALPFQLETTNRVMEKMAISIHEHGPNIVERMTAQWRRDLFKLMEVYRKKKYPSWEVFTRYYWTGDVQEEKHQYLSGDVVQNYLKKKYLELKVAEERFAIEYHSVIHREALHNQ